MRICVWFVIVAVLTIACVVRAETEDAPEQEIDAKQESNATSDQQANIEKHEEEERKGDDDDDDDDLSNYTPEMIKETLSAVVDYIDQDKDGFVNKLELTSWLQKTRQDEENEEQENRQDRQVEYPHGHENRQDKQVEYPHGQCDSCGQPHIQPPTENDNEGAEPPSSSKPRSWKDNQVDITLDIVDADHNGIISYDEFITSESRHAENDEEAKKDFKRYDLNADGQLDRQEIAKWIIPNEAELAANDAEHLFSDTDTDNDGKLTKEEILNNYELWIDGKKQPNIGEEPPHARAHDPSEL